MSGAIVQTVSPPPPPPELLAGTGVAGAGEAVGSGEGSSVCVGRRVAVGIAWVGWGLSVAGGMGVRVGRRVGGTGVGVGSALHATTSKVNNATSASKKSIKRGINDSGGFELRAGVTETIGVDYSMSGDAPVCRAN